MAETFAQVYAHKEWRGPWQLFRLVREWPDIVGPGVAELTYPAFFRQQTLWLYVQDSAWMHHLQFIKLDLLARVNRHLEQPVTDIRWQLQPPVPQQPAVAPPRPARPIDPGQEERFRQLFASVDHSESRRALQDMWRTFTVRASEEIAGPK